MKEEFEDTKGVIIIRKSKKNRQHNAQMKTRLFQKRVMRTKFDIYVFITPL